MIAEKQSLALSRRSRHKWMKESLFVINIIIIMKRYFINLLLYNPRLYSFYNAIGSSFINLFGVFIRKSRNKIVFSCLGGRKYDDSPRCIYEAMLKDTRFNDYQFVWAFNEPSKFIVPKGQSIKCDSIQYYYHLLSSSIWVTNSSMERGLYFKPDRIFNFNTWHGTPIKLMGTDIDNKYPGMKHKVKKSHEDIFLAQGKYDADIFSRVFNIPSGNMRIIGLPRNDELVYKNNDTFRNAIRKELGLCPTKKIILYAPTFREYQRDGSNNCVLLPPIDINKWKTELGDDFVLLFRAHYDIIKILDIKDDDFVKDVSGYPYLNDLMIVSDLLVSDYSSIFFDYSIQDKPMLCFPYDYEEYRKKRGMYFDIREALSSNCENEEMLIKELKELDYPQRISITQAFRSKFIQEYGSATQKALDIISEHIQ